MSAGMPCPRCGHPNGPMQVFCGKCGARLNMEQAAPARGMSWGQRAYRLLRGLMVLLAAGMVGLAFWPAEPAGEGGDARQRQTFVRTWSALGAAGAAGNRQAVTLNDRQVNAYLAWRISRPDDRPDSSRFWPPRLNAFNLHFTDGAITVFIQAACGPIPVTTRLRAVPQQTPAGLLFGVRDVRLGQLPLPGPLGQWWAEKRMRPILDRFEKERVVLKYIRRVGLAPSRARLST